MKSGDNCPDCPIGVMLTYASRRRGDSQVRFLRCDVCRRLAKEVIPADAIRRRRKRVLNNASTR